MNEVIVKIAKKEYLIVELPTKYNLKRLCGELAKIGIIFQRSVQDSYRSAVFLVPLDKLNEYKKYLIKRAEI